MLYAALTFWLLVIVFAAYGVFQLWSSLVRPKVINALLLPGTLVAQLGYILGLLITGGTVQNATLIQDDDTGAPAAAGSGRTRIPVIGPVITALLPILACGGSIYLVLATIGARVMTRRPDPQLSRRLPTTVDSFWEMLHSAVTLVQQVATSVWSSDLRNWQSWLFIYLITCLTVRMAPLPGLRRGAVGAILLVGVLAGLLGMAGGIAEQTVHGLWGTLSFVAGNLLLLMLITLTARGLIGLFRIVAGRTA